MRIQDTKAVSAFAIECRKIRLWIAAHPGSTDYEIKKANGGRVDYALSKMLGMRIIKCEHQPDAIGKRAFRWFVVPQ